MIRYIRSIMNALSGLIFALRTERNVQIWLAVAIVVISTALFLQVSEMEFYIISIWMFGIGTSEYLNTAIEKLSDRVTTEYDEQIKRVKDMSAAATFVFSSAAFLNCLYIFVPKIIEKF